METVLVRMWSFLARAASDSPTALGSRFITRPRSAISWYGQRPYNVFLYHTMALRVGVMAVKWGEGGVVPSSGGGKNGPKVE